jgi:hypothetical protein
LAEQSYASVPLDPRLAGLGTRGDDHGVGLGILMQGKGHLATLGGAGGRADGLPEKPQQNRPAQAGISDTGAVWLRLPRT